MENLYKNISTTLITIGDKKKGKENPNQYSIIIEMSKTLCHRLSIRRITLFTEETKRLSTCGRDFKF